MNAIQNPVDRAVQTPLDPVERYRALVDAAAPLQRAGLQVLVFP